MSYTPQQNGVAERFNRTLLERTRCMLSNANLWDKKSFWAEALSTACYLVNRSPNSSIDNKIPQEVWSGKPEDYSDLKVFGCPAFVHVNDGKLSPKEVKGIFLGYTSQAKGYRIWCPSLKKVVLSRDVTFDEKAMLEVKKSVNETSSANDDGLSEKIGSEVEPPRHHIDTKEVDVRTQGGVPIEKVEGLQQQEQMLAHICLKYRTDSEGLQQQEILDSLPKAIRSSISVHLFYGLVDKVYLFSGVSTDLLFQLVSEMKAEFFSPNEDVILQNEAPTDFYIIVNGSVDLLQSTNAVEQVVGHAKKGDVCGEIGVLCYKPQLFTVRTKRLCQLLRINRTTFLNIVQANVGDGKIIMNNLLQHLKDAKNDATKESFTEIENMIGCGNLDLPLSLCFAAKRGDDLLMQRLLKQGVDPNESEDNGRTALHVAASNGSEKCVRLLLDSGADPNCRDQGGSIPLWEAMLGGHNLVVKLLRDYGANIRVGDVGQYACIAAEKKNLELLKMIVCYGGDVTLPAVTTSYLPRGELVLHEFNGGTALHVAVSEANVEMVKYLLDRGSDIDKPNLEGWSPRDLAEQQAQDDIITLFKSHPAPKAGPRSTIPTPVKTNRGKFLGRFTSEPALRHLNQDNLDLSSKEMLVRPGMKLRRKPSNYENSLFGVISAAESGASDPFLQIARTFSRGSITQSYDELEKPGRVIMSYTSQDGGVVKKIVALPRSFEELLDIANNKFGFFPSRVETQCGAQVDTIEVVRDGDNLVLIRDITN